MGVQHPSAVPLAKRRVIPGAVAACAGAGQRCSRGTFRRRGCQPGPGAAQAVQGRWTSSRKPQAALLSLALQASVVLARARGSELPQDAAADVDINLTEQICIWQRSSPEGIFLLACSDFGWGTSHPFLAATSRL